MTPSRPLVRARAQARAFARSRRLTRRLYERRFIGRWESASKKCGPKVSKPQPLPHDRIDYKFLAGEFKIDEEHPPDKPVSENPISAVQKLLLKGK